MFKNFNVILIYLALSDDIIFERISARNKNLKPNEYLMDRETYNILSSKFECPDNAEQFITYENNEQLVIELKKLNIK